MMMSPNIFGFVITLVLTVLTFIFVAADGFGHGHPFKGGSFRNARNPQHSHSDQGPRFGWQNPILVAPTLPPPTVEQRPYQQTQTPWWARPIPSGPPTQYVTSPAPFPNPTYPTTQRYLPQWQPRPSPTPYNPNYPTTRRQFIPQTTPAPYYPPNPTSRPREDYNPQQRPVPPRRPTQGGDFERLPQSEAQTQQRPEKCPPRTRRGRRNGVCYPLGSSEPCGENMAFYADPSSQEFGQCDCIQNLNRPLVYHPQSDKCYFIFQQAYCRPGEWLVQDRDWQNPSCDINRCIGWTQNRSSDWDWTSNGPHLDFSGTVALLREQSCALLGWPCRKEGRGPVRPLLDESSGRLPEGSSLSQIKLTFSGVDLVCSRELERSEFRTEGSESDMKISCKPGLTNKWRLEGRCQ